MPIYEYRCNNCEHIFELFQSMGADNSKVVCPQCGIPRPDRIFSAFAAGGAAMSSGVSSGSTSGCGNGAFT